MDEKKITVYTQAYNTAPFLQQCVESVLQQSYSNFEYIIVDNGSTDGSAKLLQDYAQQDDRIALIRYEENKKDFWRALVSLSAKGEYLTVLDSDDWWEQDFLERLTTLLESENLDLAITGTVNYFEKTGTERVMRKLNVRTILTQGELAQRYPQYWIYPSTNWGSIMKTALFQKTPDLTKQLFYGVDTIQMLKYIEHCDRIGIDNSALYHYRIREKSVSAEYDENRFPSNVYFYNCVTEFLNKHDALDADKQEWLKRVHANSIRMTADTLANSKLPAGEKINELHKITEHPLTKTALTMKHPEIEQTRSALLSIALKNADAAGENFDAILVDVAPKCAPAVSPDRAQLFALKPELAAALSKDDADAFLSTLLDMLRTNEQSKKFDLVAMVRALSADKPLLKGICDKRFLRRHGDVYLAVWRERYAEALDAMTGSLLDGEKADEPFLQLYLSLAALLNQPEAFVFGKIRLAQLQLRQGDKAACRSILEELAQMGVEDNDEIAAMRRFLDE